jgi:hypothetical protein
LALLIGAQDRWSGTSNAAAFSASLDRMSLCTVSHPSRALEPSVFPGFGTAFNYGCEYKNPLPIAPELTDAHRVGSQKAIRPQYLRFRKTMRSVSRLLWSILLLLANVSEMLMLHKRHVMRLCFRFFSLVPIISVKLFNGNRSPYTKIVGDCPFGIARPGI